MVGDQEKGTYWGLVVLVGALWALIGPSLFGFLSDRIPTRYGRWKPWVAVGAALTVCALLILSNPAEYWVLVAAYLFLQVADDVGQGPYSALIPSLVAPDQRGKASGIMGLLQLFAQVAGGITAFLLKDPKLIYYAIAFVTILCAFITIATVKEDRNATSYSKIRFTQAWIMPWRNHDFRWVWFTRFLNALGFYLISTYMLFYLIDIVREFSVFGVVIANTNGETKIDEAAQQSMFIIALLISSMGAIGAWIGGNLADKIGRKKVVYLSGFTMALVIPPMILFANFSLLVCLAILFGVAYGGNQSAEWALASDVMPSKEDVAKDMGLWQSSIAAPQIFSGASGRLLDYGNSIQSGLGYIITFSMASIAFFLGTILVRKIKGSS